QIGVGHFDGFVFIGEGGRGAQHAKSKEVSHRAFLVDSCVAMNVLVALFSLVSSDVATRRDAVVQVVEKVSPAVVYVGTVQIVERSFRSGNPLDDFFFGPRERTEAIEGLGSGV